MPKAMREKMEREREVRRAVSDSQGFAVTRGEEQPARSARRRRSIPSHPLILRIFPSSSLPLSNPEATYHNLSYE